MLRTSHFAAQRGVLDMALLVAAIAHAAVVVAFLTVAPEARTPTLRPKADVAVSESLELTLDIEQVVSPRKVESTAAAATTEHASAAIGPSASRDPTDASSVPASPSEPSEEARELSPPDAFPPLMIVAPAIGAGRNPVLVAGASPEAPPMDPSRTARPEAKSAAEAKQAVEQSMKAEMRAQDVNVGLGPEGPVVHALVDATSESLAPERGNAMFLAVVDGGGIVVDLRLVSSNGDQRGWADARARALRALAGTKLALRGAKGAELRIGVTSDVRLPSGNLPGKPIKPTLSDSKVVLPENVPQGGTADVVKTYTVATFDVTDIGAKPRRIVHATLVSLSPL